MNRLKKKRIMCPETNFGNIVKIFAEYEAYRNPILIFLI